jgi:hypothetical protein
VGAFGNNAHMQKMCGDATILIARAAAHEKVARFVFISESHVGSRWMSHDRMPPWAPLYGYFIGKERAEAAVMAQYDISYLYIYFITSYHSVNLYIYIYIYPV